MPRFSTLTGFGDTWRVGNRHLLRMNERRGPPADQESKFPP